MELIEPITQKKLEKVTDNFGLNDDGTLQMTKAEQVFYQVLKETGNATEAWRQMNPQKAKELAPGTIRNAAMILVKKLGVRPLCHRNSLSLKKKIFQRKKINNAQHRTEGEGITAYAQKQFEVGAITEEELWDTMVKLSRYAVQETVRMNATERLKAWYDAVKNDITANNLGEKDIVDLFISSLGALPREKYKRVLSGVRQVRHIKIARQNDIIDVDAEVAKFKKELADRSVKERIATEFPDLNEPEYGKEITSPDCNDVALPDTEENLFGGITHGHGPKS